jgi:hypothetical protein
MNVQRMTALLFPGGRRSQSDPAEPWETPYTGQDGGEYFRAMRTPHPFVPASREDAPPGAFDALAAPCGVEDIRQLFVIPSCVRFTGRGADKVVSPMQVVALGARAVGLWTAEPTPEVRAIIGIDSLAYIEDIHILLYGKLTFFSRQGRISIRYNTVARRVLEPALLALRLRMAGASGPVPICEQAEALPFKWRLIAGSPFHRLGDDEPAVWRFSPRARAQLLMMTPRELLSLADPADSVHRFGVDGHYVPRAGIEEARFDDCGLRLRVKGATLELALDERLRDAARLWLSGPGPTREL